ncbi:uncharacterized protein LOC107364157 isoform X2 [Tetranychus urticae]|uniref:uncharacterized protein LOC107364157 isoform X2 n=1 Tax=Tetranychus urticae TaxID=32264 RepID=UPI000D645D6C|nr:uncharacterized protein LOC107364157 isoform X2 [Tetranychus urticae]
MDVNETLGYFQQQTLSPTEPASLEQRMEEVASLSTFPSISPNDVENILNSLSPIEDTVDNHIGSAPEYTVYTNDYNMDLGHDSFERLRETSPEYNNQITSNDVSQNYQSNNLQSDSVRDDFQLFSPSSINNNGPKSSSSFFSDISNASTPMETNFTRHLIQNSTPSPSTPSPRAPFNCLKRAAPSSQLHLNPTYHQSNKSNSKDRGFKSILSLCTETSIVKEPWKPKVAKKILAAYYTPINLKSEFLATQISLDEFQSIAMKEAVVAFHALALREPVCYKQGGNDDAACPGMLALACKDVRSYKKLLFEDKITLLSNIFFDIIALESVLTYDYLTDCWTCSSIKISRRDVFRMDPSLHNGIVRIIETFPDRWRRDLTIRSLLYLIVIFNPDLPDLKFKEYIRLEQYTYIYILRRYLEMNCKSPCVASDYHYRLMAKIADIQNLRLQMRYFFEMCLIDYSTMDCIIETFKKWQI